MSRSWLAALDLELGRYADARPFCSIGPSYDFMLHLHHNEHGNLRAEVRKSKLQTPGMYLTKRRDARSRNSGLLGERLSGRPGVAALAGTTPWVRNIRELWQGFSFPVATPTGYLHCWPSAMLTSMPGPRAWMVCLGFTISIETCECQVYDHYRVLRVVPRVVIHSMSVDFCAQAPRQAQKQPCNGMS